MVSVGHDDADADAEWEILDDFECSLARENIVASSSDVDDHADSTLETSVSIASDRFDATDGRAHGARDEGDVSEEETLDASGEETLGTSALDDETSRPTSKADAFVERVAVDEDDETLDKALERFLAGAIESVRELRSIIQCGAEEFSEAALEHWKRLRRWIARLIRRRKDLARRPYAKMVFVVTLGGLVFIIRRRWLVTALRAECAQPEIGVSRQGARSFLYFLGPTERRSFFETDETRWLM
ncbi:unnamed product [Ostreococcus tauri]|uniref:Unnamed product n=1 Tax=Ostreococcus tauri TaxID=70448 RepID=A0A090M8W8_OSTTA|nr:unnamed product [Ostreococcus tauri]OUS47127.1 hypothetical protein BE221DRAFT_167573 [Ostreococcus tauri]CEG01603.1 unnamed product [Ostreococcus tauri]|eukprot:XP_022841056.1 unnamed product [Ostreococcus tauri]